jgi:H/ACA ribonucleoprotein complex subunit 3
MTVEVYICQRKVKLKPQDAIGRGGEAEVFRWGRDWAVKLFKPPTHPDYTGFPQAQQAATQRLATQPRKLRQFPTGLPETVIAPQDLVTDRTGQQVLGYTMPLIANATVLLHYGERRFRQGVPSQRVVEIFLNLHDTVRQLHQQQVIIGDFNDLNVLVKDTSPYLIDADSFQFGTFPCSMFTARFVDPRLCDPQAPQLLLTQSHDVSSDWYAFTVMLMQCFLFVDPYGGVYRPSSSQQMIPASARPLHRITIFHPAVRYPKPALPYDRLPDDLLHHFQAVFCQDWRGIFPRTLLEQLQWTTCPTCGMDHARSHCPQCQASITTVLSPVTPVTQATVSTIVRGTLTVTVVFSTPGIILYATPVTTQTKTTLDWIYWHQGQFYQGDGTPILDGQPSPHLHWGQRGKQPWVAQGDQVIVFDASLPQKMQRFTVDRYRGVPQFTHNATHYYWLEQGILKRDQTLGSVTGLEVTGSAVIGEVLRDQTQFWVGSTFGFGFYQAGHLHRAFVFDTQRLALNDQVSLPRWPGELVSATCTFSQTYGWLFLTVHDQGILRRICHVMNASGVMIASADSSTHPWLNLLGSHSNHCPYCAVNHFLLAATDQGIIKIEIQGNQLMQTQQFSDTEPFVDSNCQLLPHTDGLWVISSQKIQLFKLQSTPAP